MLWVTFLPDVARSAVWMITKEIKAYVPLSEMFGYASDLRSKTQGRGQYVMEPSHYVEVPKSIAEEIIKHR